MPRVDLKQLSHEELRLLYQVTVNDLAYFKTQQWSVTNYALLVLAGLVAAAQILRPNIAPLERVGLTCLAVLSAFGTLVVLAKLRRSISVRQARLDALRDSFSGTFNLKWAAEVKGREYLHAHYFLFAAVPLATALVSWLIYRV
jgi:hypothetical protein